MTAFDRGKYTYSVIEGSGDILTEIEIRRHDGDEITPQEVSDLLSEIRDRFPEDLYKINHETKVQEDDTRLHVYVSLAKEERLRRTKGVLGQRVIVPRQEVQKQLEGW